MVDSVSAFYVFVQVADARSFVAAGRALGVSASAVGKSIARLEERLGVRLFHRSTRSITLTGEGARFLERSRRILAEIEDAEAEISDAAVAPRGVLRISLPLIVEPLLPTLVAFKRAYPEIDLDLDFTDRRVDVVEEGFDAVLRNGEAQDSRLMARRLGTFRQLLVASPEYLGRHGVPEHPRDLVRHSCLQFRHPNTGKLQLWPLTGDGVDVDLRLPSAIVSNNPEARLCFAREGLGIACLGDFVVRRDLRDGRLIKVLEDYVDGSDTFRILWPSGRNPPPKLRVFIDYLTARLFPQAGAED